MSGTNVFAPIVMKDQIDSSKVLASGQHQYIHQNNYSHLITPGRITCYIEDTEQTGMTTQSTNLMDTNALMRMSFILYPKNKISILSFAHGRSIYLD